MTDLPTTVGTEITTHPEQGRDVLKIDGRTIGCKIKDRLSIEEAELILNRWWETENNRQWQWGDFILQCEQRWGDESVSQIIPDHDIAAQTLANWSSVAKQYTHSERLYDLRWSHYAEVAYVWNRDLRTELLTWAESGGKTVAELREQKKKRLDELAKVAETTQDAQDDDLQPATDESVMVYSSDEISGILAGNIKPLIRLFATWRERVKTGKRYKLMLIEVE